MENRNNENDAILEYIISERNKSSTCAVYNPWFWLSIFLLIVLIIIITICIMKIGFFDRLSNSAKCSRARINVDGIDD